MSPNKAGAAAATLWKNWQQRTRTDEPPAGCRPLDRAEGYGVQAEVVRISGQSVALTWIANELATYGEGLRAGEIVTTGTCVYRWRLCQATESAPTSATWAR